MSHHRCNTPQTNVENAEKAVYVYSLLLRLYPRTHRQEYGSLMLQTFRDLYHEAQATHGHSGSLGPVGVRAGVKFWLETLADVVTSALGEQWSVVHEEVQHMRHVMQRLWNHLGVFAGFLLGALASVIIVWTNIVFPSTASDSAYTAVYLLGYASLFLVFAVIGFLASRRTNRIVSGTWAGVSAALLGSGIALATFLVVDNLFLAIVSQQVDKVQGFHQSSFPTMREYINVGLLYAVLMLLPMLGVAGALMGTLGAALQKRIRGVSA